MQHTAYMWRFDKFCVGMEKEVYDHYRDAIPSGPAAGEPLSKYASEGGSMAIIGHPCFRKCDDAYNLRKTVMRLYGVPASGIDVYRITEGPKINGQILLPVLRRSS